MADFTDNTKLGVGLGGQLSHQGRPNMTSMLRFLITLRDAGCRLDSQQQLRRLHRQRADSDDGALHRPVLRFPWRRLAARRSRGVVLASRH